MSRLFDATISPQALFDPCLLPRGLFDEWLVDGSSTAMVLRGVVRSMARLRGASVSEMWQAGIARSGSRIGGVP